MKSVEEEDLDSFAAKGTEDSASIVELPENVDLVDLIEQPAWKTILIELVKRERMDPWSIDIAQLAAKYLNKINSLSITDLRIPANAILASAILLKFKANVLMLSEMEDEDEFLGKNKEMTAEERAEFEALIPDLKNIRKIKEGKVSLEQLVSTIELMLAKSRKTKDSAFLGRERAKFLLPFSDFEIDKAMDKVYRLISRNADSQGMVLFSRLVKESDTNETIVRTFIPCLFLTNKGRINMWQETFFDEIFLSLTAENQTEQS